MFIKTTTAILALAALASPAFAQGDRAITGAVTYLQRMALPQDAELLIDVTGPHGVSFFSDSLKTEGKSVPFPFAFTLPEGVAAEARFSFVSPEGGVLFSSGDVALAAGQGDLALDEIVLKASEPENEVEYLCEGTPLRARFSGDQVTLIDETGVERVLTQAISASGARYVDPKDEENTFFWTKGDTASYRVEGGAELDCVSAPAETYQATGFEPMWGLSVTESNYSFLHDLDAPPLEGYAVDVPRWSEGRVVWELAEGLVFEAKPELCLHPATGMPHPEKVSVRYGEKTFEGCGGAPLSLLLGSPWQVEALAGATLVEGTEGTLAFDKNGSAYGRAFCNMFNVAYDLTGESLTFKPGIVTQMACPEPMMALEGGYLTALDQVQRFEITPEGKLLLLDLEGKALITAHR